MLRKHPAGDYSFVPGIAPYSCGVISSPGFEIVHVTLRNMVSWQAGFELIRQVLRDERRDQTALCAVSLRSPKPFSFAGFSEFNTEYEAVLRSWGVFVENLNPIARTNIVPETLPPAEPSLFGFAYTRPCPPSLSPTFVVAGAGELPEGFLNRDCIHCLGDVSPDGILAKSRFVLNLMSTRLQSLGTGWQEVTRTNVYTVYPVNDVVERVLEPAIGPASRLGISWFYSRPPIEEIEYEMDVRGVRCEKLF
ncbi:MAG: hypothetical protein JNL58_07155 [Planctomyces sp.]|nr:hypothetical protein [Planctomyces sp.]